MKKNKISLIIGSLAISMSLVGCGALAVRFSNLNNNSSTTNGGSTTIDIPLTPDENESKDYFIDGTKYRLPLESFGSFYRNLCEMDYNSEFSSNYNEYLNFDFSSSNKTFSYYNGASHIGHRALPLGYIFNLPFSGDLFSYDYEYKIEEYISLSPNYDYEEHRYTFSAVLEYLAQTLSYRQSKNGVVETISTYYDTLTFSFRNELTNDNDSFEYRLLMNVEIELNELGENAWDGELPERLSILSSTFNSDDTFHMWSKENDENNLISCCSFDIILGEYECNILGNNFRSGGSLNGYFDFTFDMEKQVAINPLWTEKQFNAWLYSNLYAEEMSV